MCTAWLLHSTRDPHSGPQAHVEITSLMETSLQHPALVFDVFLQPTTPHSIRRLQMFTPILFLCFLIPSFYLILSNKDWEQKGVSFLYAKNPTHSSRSSQTLPPMTCDLYFSSSTAINHSLLQAHSTWCISPKTQLLMRYLCVSILLQDYQ